MSYTKDPISSYDKYPGGELKDEAPTIGTPDDGPALLLMNYDIVFVVSGPIYASTKVSSLCRFKG
jgi:hypothetical protein